MKVLKKYTNNLRPENHCPICKKALLENVSAHLQSNHSQKEIAEAIIKAKEANLPDAEIGERFGITFRQLEKIITRAYGVNISSLKSPKRIKFWAPPNFQEEKTTVWSFKQRGNWATHDGRYRGNWSPYIPRNVILKYSKPGDIVLDYFVGGGTTAIEAKLLGRRCIARDINPSAVSLTKENLKFEVPKNLLDNFTIYEPEVAVGDARNLSDLSDESIDLICAHPPYANIIHYTTSEKADLSFLEIDDFLNEMLKVARESFRVLKPGGKCAILIGDLRRKKHVVPLGFKLMDVYLNAGFKLRELVIKRQHNCKTTGFWYQNSLKYNFLLLAHEYLPIFEKPPSICLSPIKRKNLYDMTSSTETYLTMNKILDVMETTTVWEFSGPDYELYLNKNVIDRYSKNNSYTIITFRTPTEMETKVTNGKDLLFVKCPFLGNNPSHSDIGIFLKKLKEVIVEELSERFVVIQTQDVRIGHYIEPMAKKIVDLFASDNLWLKEIVSVTHKVLDQIILEPDNYLELAHQYLLIYEVLK